MLVCVSDGAYFSISFSLSVDTSDPNPNSDPNLFLFIFSLFFSVLFEDNSVNRMQESLNLFTEVVKNPLFKSTPIFVFLNKKDLFEEMIPKTPLKTCFPDYTGAPGEVRPALEFIEKRYKMIMQEHVPGKTVYVHVIAARLRMDMKIAFGEVDLI